MVHVTMNDPAGSKSFPKYEDVIEAFNVIMSHSPPGNSEIASIGWSCFFPIDEPMLQIERGELSWNEAIRGHLQSPRPATGHLLLNANVSYEVLRPNGPAFNLFTQAALYNMHTLHKNMPKLWTRRCQRNCPW
ncbi:uncharacterized protein B0I36DRAFT_353633 [Microdochium trichocladiopsis]|uniref:Argonaute linker 1 domain-containing protein n=1 Tax=Microdochium trichocladiopsis TaxID=1682393 RepID=A0A9P8XVH6_9PEZI|nr:uncharacterized protein B0I36DRAFT_353633 [Microdochium trichocladiopsis]KAH7020899.1 hypothetical protein B0I36DRAFT_353633 [Microdochium trichocladiopsis]